MYTIIIIIIISFFKSRSVQSVVHYAVCDVVKVQSGYYFTFISHAALDCD